MCAVVRRPRVMPYKILILSMSARMIAEPSRPPPLFLPPPLFSSPVRRRRLFRMMMLKGAGGEGGFLLGRIRVREDWSGLSEHDRP